MNEFLRRSASCALAVLMACVLSVTSVEAGPVSAQADEAADAQQAVGDAQVTLDSAEERMQAVVADHTTLSQEIAALQERIDETTVQAMAVQQEVIEGRAALGDLALYEYRGGTTQSLVTLVLSSSDFDELIRNLSYLEAVMRYQADEIAAQKERSARFAALVDDLNVQKDAQEAKLQEVEAKQAEAEQVAADAAAQLQDAQTDYAARLDALKQMADALAASQGEDSGAIAEGWDTNTRLPDVDTNQPVQSNPDPNPPGAPQNPGSETGDTGNNDVGWSVGIASAYGGSTDPYTPNPGTTAAGAVCDDWSMGVAVPMSWPNYSSYFGRTVEISYGGMTVFATVNDCGYMGGGSRSLDLQPGVWKAFGFSSCNDWGLREVSYRFL